jgi:hypothetical protein
MIKETGDFFFGELVVMKKCDKCLGQEMIDVF